MTERRDLYARIAADLEGGEEYGSAEYWETHAARPERLKPMGRPCQDCAVTSHFYSPASFSLAKQPDDIVEAVWANWFCHNNPNRACKGNIEFVEFLRESK